MRLTVGTEYRLMTDLLTPCSSFAQLSKSLMSERMQPKRCEYGLNLLMLETDDDIIEGLRDKAEMRKNQLVTETAPSLG